MAAKKEAVSSRPKRAPDGAVNAIADAGFDPVYGARPLKRYMQAHLETMLARKIVSGEILPGEAVTVDADETGLTIG